MSILLFYKKPVPLSTETHRNLRVKPIAGGYAYASTANSVPVTAAEIGSVASEYPIVFAPDGSGGMVPMVMLGVREQENLFVDANGGWDAQYIPMFVRCYPFAFYKEEKEQNAVVVIDEDYAGFNETEGLELFNPDGSASAHVEGTVELLQHFHASAEHTMKLTSILAKHGLLVPQTMDINGPNGKKFGLDGFSLIDEGKLAELEDSALLEIVKSGAMALAYGHLFSLNNVQKVVQRLESRLIAEMAA
ncbi:MAG: hypothetical protein K0S28_596 [Paucimonas sp.]|nr:hypothetical protein [Paucimonas sp.]